MSRKYPPPDYQDGALVTGIDRSFPRSIYRYHGMRLWQTKIAMELIIYKGVRGNGGIENFPAKNAKEYRLATREELIESGAIPQSVDFITHA